MSATKLTTKRVQKPWGRTDLGPWFPDATAEEGKIGEIWFEAQGDPSLLIKFLFTSEKLSVQVHPDDAAAHAAGHERGKDEAWVVLGVKPESTMGVGLTHKVSKDELRAAALDGSIEKLIDWRPVHADDVFYSPADTIHAIGAGVTVIEVQQNVDLTYRLYDYGSARELHLDQAMKVAKAEPFTRTEHPRDLGDGRRVVADGPKFIMERWQGAGTSTTDAPQTWVTLARGSANIDGAQAGAGETWIAGPGTTIARAQDADIVVATPK